MKSLFFSLLLFAFSQLSAQQSISPKDLIVKDSSGQELPVEIWQALLMKGTYDLKPEGNKTFLLVRLSEEETIKRMEKLAKPKPSTSFIDGKKTPLFKASDLEGKKMNLDDSSGKIIVLNFWFIKCGPCRMEIPDLNNLVDSFSRDKVEFVAIALDNAGDLEDFIKLMPFKYRIIPDGRNLALNYGIKGYPTHAIIDQEGRVYFHTTGLGRNTIYWLKKSIKELIAKRDFANK